MLSCNNLSNYYSIDDGVRLTKDNVKDLINIMLYGGTFNTWVVDLGKDKPNKNKKGFKINHNKPKNNFIVELEKDIKLIHDKIIDNNFNLYNSIDGKDNEYEKKCSCISYWFQIIENHILYITY